MRALLLAAGIGSRLRPITDSVPKCLVPINGKPLLEIWMERLVAAGIESALLNTHYLNDQVEAFIANGNYRDFASTTYESTLLGTAGTLINNLGYFGGEDGMMIHADNYCLADLLDFQKAHKSRPHDCLMTMMTFRTDQPSACGIVGVNAQGVVINFYEKQINPPSNLANGAVYILSAELIKMLRVNFCNASVTQLGIALGMLSLSAVSEDFGQPAKFNISNGTENDIPAFANGQLRS